MAEIENFNWNQYKEIGDESINHDKEGIKRTGISRYYYASFCKCRNYLRTNGIYRHSNSKKF